MSAAGVFGVARDVFDHPLFDEKREFSKLEAWLWMLREASWKDRPARSSTSLRRGQFVHSIRFMADAWGWHRARVERFLTRLKIETMIETQTETGRTLVTICNYDKYQKVALPDRDAVETGSEGQPRQTKKKEYTDTIVSGTEVPDFKAALFREGLASLRRQTGKAESTCRSMIGRWLKITKNDPAKVLTKIRQAEADQVADAVAWIEAALRDRSEYQMLFGRG